ncbi:MAG: Ig-like domain-containing protein [Pseudomonas sp.]|uniref:Ig-like domain-containing protein n=1 Tax=Pseudomonas sp. TaxID=306 RepID=UPI003D6FD80A
MATTPPDTSTSSASTYEAVPPEIPGGIRLGGPPAEPGEDLWGINHGAALDNFPKNGLQLYIQAWTNMSVGDSVSVLLDNGEVASERIQAGEAGQRVTTFVPAVRLEAGRQKKTLQYILRRLGQVPENSAERNIYVKLDRPGGQDQDGDNPGHSELTFSLPEDIVNDGVDAEAAKKGVQITVQPYPNMAELDEIKLSWGGVFVLHEVLKEEIGKPIVIIADEATIVAAGDSGANGLAVTYEVYDLVHNRSEDWAAEARIVVDTGNSRLGFPLVKGTVDNVLDLDALGDQPAIVQVVAQTRSGVLSAELKNQFESSISRASLGRETLENVLTLNADFNKGDKIVVRLKGTSIEGIEIDYEAPEELVDNLPTIYEIPVPNPIIRQLAKTQVVFSYRVIRQDGAEAKSKGAFIQVVGEPVRMAAPIAKDAAQGAIDPDLANTLVEVPWDNSMMAGDVIILKWVGIRPDTTIYDPELPIKVISNGEAASKQPIPIQVEGNHLKAVEGGTLELYYLLEKYVDGSTVIRESARLPLLRVGEPKAELPAPTVSGVVDGVMDPALVQAILTAPVYTHKAVGDQVHCLWNGSASGQYSDWVDVGERTKDLPIDFTISGSLIKPNEGGTVEASYWVIRKEDNRRSDSELTAFSVGRPEQLDPPTISSIKDLNNLEIRPGATTFETSVNVTGTASPDQEVEIFDGDVSKGKVTANANGTWTKPLNGLTTGDHAIKAVAQYGDGAQSAVRSFTVISVKAIAITDVKDSKGTSIPDGGTTPDTTVTVSGTVTYS